MKIIKTNGKVEDAPGDVDFDGTSLQGFVHIPYSRIVAVFGPPTSCGDEYKTDAEWDVMTPDGEATIYNWKNGKNYCGERGLSQQDITDWNIGGKSKNVVKWIQKAFDQN